MPDPIDTSQGNAENLSLAVKLALLDRACDAETIARLAQLAIDQGTEDSFVVALQAIGRLATQLQHELDQMAA